MFLSTLVAIAASFMQLSAAAPSSSPTSYCPSTGSISDDERLGLFKAFNQELFSASSNPGAVASSFAKYVSPNLIEHTASADSYGADVGFLTVLFPTVNVAVLSGLQGCFKTESGSHVCSIHYKATPKGPDSLITNTTVISDFYRYEGSCIVEHWDSTMTANAATTNPGFP